MKGPFIRSDDSTSKMMKYLIISLIPLIAFTIFKNCYIPYINGYSNIFSLFYPLLFIFIGALSTYLFEIIWILIFDNKNLKNTLVNGYGYIPGIFLAMILPFNTPIIVLIIGCLFATVIGKMVYGGFGNNVFNPALIGYIVVTTCYASVLSECYLNPYEIDAIASSTPLTNLKMVESLTYNNVVAPYGNLLDFFIGTIPGSLCETSSLLCLIALIFLGIKKVIKIRIPIFYILTFFIMNLILSVFLNIGIWYLLFQIFSGGLLFGAVFMSTDPVTSPVTIKGQIIYGICLGILTFLFRNLTSAPEGVCLAILTMNMLVFIVDKIGLKLNNKKSNIIASLSILIILFGLSYYTYTTLNKQSIDNDYNIISKINKNNNITYVVTQKGNGGNIKASIEFKDNKIISINILENNETEAYYKKLLDSNYIEKLINGQNNIKEIDTVTGATISSTALKKMVINTLKDYGEKYEQ